MNQLTLALPDELYSRLAKRASVEEKTPEEIALERLRREFGEGFLDSQTAKGQASAFLRKRAGIGRKKDVDKSIAYVILTLHSKPRLGENRGN